MRKKGSDFTLLNLIERLIRNNKLNGVIRKLSSYKLADVSFPWEEKRRVLFSFTMVKLL